MAKYKTITKHITLPARLAELLEAKAGKAGFTLPEYIRHLGLRDLEKGPTIFSANQTDTESNAHNEPVTPEVTKFVQTNKELFWDIDPKAFNKLTLGKIFERVLSYGTMENVKQIITLLGIEKCHKIFHYLSKKRRSNLKPETINYFNSYFKKHASGSIE